MKVKFDFKKKNVLSTPLRKAKESLNKTINKNTESSIERVNFLKSVIDCQTPVSKKNFMETLSLEPSMTSISSAVAETYTTLKHKRDKLSNCVKRVLLNSVESNLPYRKVRKLGASYSSYKSAKSDTLAETIFHYKGVTKRPKVLTKPVKDAVIQFYNQDIVSRVVPFKNKTVKIKDENGIYVKVSIRIMECTLLNAYQQFQVAHPEVKIDRRSFEKLRPKNIRLKRCAQRLVCACSYHLNL